MTKTTLHIVQSDDIVNVNRRGRHRRPQHIVTHLEPPGFHNPLDGTRRTYGKIAAIAKGHLKGTWVLHDVHIVDHAVVEVMTLLKLSWQHARRNHHHNNNIHIYFISPCPEAAIRWMHYIAGKDAIANVHLPSPSPSPAPPTSVMVEYAPNASPVFVSNWIYSRDLKGDVLVFTASATHRQEMVRELNIYKHEHYPIVELGGGGGGGGGHKLFKTSQKGPPRIIVGTSSSLDFLVSLCPEMVARVQHVVDFGTVWYQRQDTGNDWEEGVITQTMALRRLRIAGTKAPGICLRMYKDMDTLSKQCFAVHALNHDLCRAKLIMRSSVNDAFATCLPLTLRPCTLTFSVANIMSLLHVETPVARIIHKGSFDMGIAVAAIVARHPGTDLQLNYQTCKEGRLPQQVLLYIQKWSMYLGRSRHHVLKCLRKSHWNDVVSLIQYGYSHTVARYTHVDNWYIDMDTGDILTYQKYNNGVRPNVLVYVHRHKQDIVVGVGVHDEDDDDNNHDDNVNPSFIDTLDLTSPLRLDNKVQIEAMHAFFVDKQVVATCTSSTKITLIFHKNKRTHIQTLANEWTRLMKEKAKDMPLLLPLGNDMHLIVTAGLQFSDAVVMSDFIVIGCDEHTMTTKDLSYIHTVPGKWYRNKPSFLLPKRTVALDMWNHVDNIFLRSLNSVYDAVQWGVPKLSITIVVRTYVGKSTGKAVIRAHDKAAWVQRIQTSWNWIVDADQHDTMTSDGNTLTMVSNIPEHYDEQDIADMLHLEPDQVLVGRLTQQVAPVTFVTEFFHHMDPSAMVKTTRSSRYYEFSMDVPQDQIERTLECVYQYLPTHNHVINQPLRVYFLLSTSIGPHPPSQYAYTHKQAPTRIHCNGCIKNEVDLVRFGICVKQDEIERLVPDLVWLPSLVAPWIQVDIPYVERCEEEPALFRIYGTHQEKKKAREQLQQQQHQITVTVDMQGKYDTCPICFEPNAFYALDLCGCRFCFVCLSKTFQIKCDEPLTVCPMECPLCHELVGTEDLQRLVPQSSLQTYARKLAGCLSKRIPDTILTCPANCGTFGRPLHQTNVFECPTCDAEWCVKCSHNYGSAVKAHKGYCDKRWETPFWKEFAVQARDAGAKGCPVCGTFVVKDGGCNHITCEGPQCGTHFCWKCVQAFSPHQSSPQAQGIVVDIREDVVVISVRCDTWNLPCKTPCPEVVHYKPDFAQASLVEEAGNETLKQGSKVWVFSYIYDHIDACVS